MLKKIKLVLASKLLILVLFSTILWSGSHVNAQSKCTLSINTPINSSIWTKQAFQNEGSIYIIEGKVTGFPIGGPYPEVACKLYTPSDLLISETPTKIKHQEDGSFKFGVFLPSLPSNTLVLARCTVINPLTRQPTYCSNEVSATTAP